jgi:hypothetical protein
MKGSLSVLLYAALAISLPVANSALGGTVSSNKLLSVLLLAAFQYYRVAVHPLLPMPGTSLGVHLKTFIPIAFGTLTIAFFMKAAGIYVGYPALGSVQEAFLVPYTVFSGYLILFTTLISHGYSRQWANLALIVTLLTIETAPFHMNPIISLVSIVFRGLNVIYAIHIAAITAAVFTMHMVNNLKTAMKKVQ